MTREELLRDLDVATRAGDLELARVIDRKLESLPSEKSSKPSTSEDAIKSALVGLPKGAAALAGMPVDAWDALTKGGAWVASKFSDIPLKDWRTMVDPKGTLIGSVLPSSQNIRSTAEKVTGPWYEPKTQTGKYLEKGVEGAVGGAGGRATAAVGAVSGLGGEAAVQLTKDERMRIVGSLGLGLPLGVAVATRGTIGSNVNNALENVTDAQLLQAQQLMERARTMGTPITGAEAIAQVTGKNSLQDIQRVVENSSRGGPILQPMMNARPDANRAAFTQALDRVSPAPVNPAATPVDLTNAAQGAITTARQAGNAAATPLYDAARLQRAPATAWNSITQDPIIVDALRRVQNNPRYGVTNPQPGSVEWLDEAKKFLDAEIRAAQQAGRFAEQMRLETSRRNLVSAVDATIPEYAQARAIVAQNRQNVVNPMQASPVGDIARTAGQTAEVAMGMQRGILMPQAPAALNPGTIQYTARTLAGQNQQALPRFTRQSLQSQFDEAAQNLVGGANQWGGAKFAAQTAGNPSQRANLDALLEATGGPQAREGFANFLQVMEAQGKRHAVGSQTEFNRQISGNLSTQGAAGVLALAASPGRLANVAKDWYDAYRYGANTAEMARVLMDPRSVEILRELGRTAPDSARARVLAMSLVALGRDTQGEATRQSNQEQGLLGRQ